MLSGGPVGAVGGRSQQEMVLCVYTSTSPTPKFTQHIYASLL